MNPLDFGLGPSKWMKTWLYGLLILCLIVLAQASRTQPGFLVLMFPLGWYISKLFLRYIAFADEYSVRRIILAEDNSVIVHTATGKVCTGQLAGDAWDTPYMVVLNVKLEERSRALRIPVFPDAMADRAQFHELRVRLKTGS